MAQFVGIDPGLVQSVLQKYFAEVQAGRPVVEIPNPKPFEGPEAQILALTMIQKLARVVKDTKISHEIHQITTGGIEQLKKSSSH
jgi:hypothetical protein